MNKKALQRNIMRRVYYTYGIRFATDPILVHGFVMLALLILLTYFVSIGNVIENMKGVEVSALGRFFFNAVSNTEAWTLLIVGGLAMAAFSLRFNLVSFRRAIGRAKKRYA
jgi:type II secretory pathway component PulF